MIPSIHVNHLVSLWGLDGCQTCELTLLKALQLRYCMEWPNSDMIMSYPCNHQVTNMHMENGTDTRINTKTGSISSNPPHSLAPVRSHLMPICPLSYFRRWVSPSQLTHLLIRWPGPQPSLHPICPGAIQIPEPYQRKRHIYFHCQTSSGEVPVVRLPMIQAGSTFKRNWIIKFSMI